MESLVGRCGHGVGGIDFDLLKTQLIVWREKAKAMNAREKKQIGQNLLRFFHESAAADDEMVAELKSALKTATKEEEIAEANNAIELFTPTLPSGSEVWVGCLLIPNHVCDSRGIIFAHDLQPSRLSI